MIEPGASMALKFSSNKKIGVIGTRATISNKAYSTEIKKMEPAANIYEKPCPLFVPFAEEGWLTHKATYEVAEEYLKELREHEIDTLVLGCTHYPILADVIQEVMGNNVKLIDSGVASAEVIKNMLQKNNLLSESDERGVQEFYVSDIPKKFREEAELFLGRPIDDVHKVDLEEMLDKIMSHGRKFPSIKTFYLIPQYLKLYFQSQHKFNPGFLSVQIICKDHPKIMKMFSSTGITVNVVSFTCRTS